MAAVMSELTTITGQLDSLRVAVTRQVRQRGLYRRSGAANVAGWLRADPRVADEAGMLSRLAAMTPQLPKISGLLANGAVSLAQAGTACWQISQLPPVITRPEQADAQPPAGDEQEQAPVTDPPDDREDPWAGLWRGGDVHAAAEELLAQFMPGLNCPQLRILGAHLHEAADAQERAGDDYSDFARRSLRISRTFGGTAHLTGRLHPEAAEQVIAAFEELAAKTGPGDDRTKEQRQADALAYLAGLAWTAPATPATDPDAEPDAPAGPKASHGAATGHGEPEASHGAATGYGEPEAGASPEAATGPCGPGPQDVAGEPDDDEPIPGGGHGHPDRAARGHTHPAGTGGHVPAGLRRPRVIVTIPWSTLTGQPLAPGAVLGTGTPLTAEAARRLSCDAEIIRLITADQLDPSGGQDPSLAGDATAQLTALLAAAIAQLPRPLGGPSAALDIGRKSQSWTPRQRDALYAQYGGRCCRAGCTRPIDVIHHIRHWLHGGKTKTRNGAPVCLYDHWLVHEGGWQILRQPDGALIFIPPPSGWRPGTIYRHGKPLAETHPHSDAA